ncbi:MAG: 2-hydroxy-3-keto-5-methylthiopentenyl-1-phosphate phosphatase [Pleurocapsa sp.]
MKAHTVVFCDFDGTITATETFADMLKEFAPDISARLLPLIYARTLTLNAGVKQILGSIPANQYQQIIKRTADRSIRSGFIEFLDFLQIHHVPFIVVSGGLLGMVKAVLEHLQRVKSLSGKITAIHAADVDTTGEYLQVNSQWEGDTELVDKVKVMEAYPAAETIAIGDSVTDINMALRANLVFARDRLIAYLEAENKPYIPWNDFFDIQSYLARKWAR